MEPVKFRDCTCPGTPHPDGDTITFKDRLTFEENVAAVTSIMTGDNIGIVSKAWGIYLHAGPIAWNVLDEQGRAVLLTREVLDGLSFDDQWEIADRADDIYGKVALAPLVRRTSVSSKNGQTSTGSPRRTKPSPKPRAR